ncbi:MAG: prolyl-tRNA synthetase associated domain-containing protein [Clostridia bacterium]
MQKNNKQTIYDYLNSKQIDFECCNHNPVESMEDCALPSKILGAPFCKNLFLCNRQKTEFFLLIIREDKKFKTAEVSKKIGKARLSFGESDALFELLGTVAGAISPMGLVFDTGRKVTLIVDKDLLSYQKMCFHPVVNDASLAMSVSDFFSKFLPSVNCEPIIIEIDGESVL